MTTYRRRYLIIHRPRWSLIEPGVHWAHSTPDGGPVLRTELGWRTISGLIFATPRLVVFAYFRRGSI